MKHIYNLKPTPPTHKFHSSNLKVSQPSLLPIPPKVDLRDSGLFDDVYDQSTIGSCTANAFAAAFNYMLRYQKLPPLLPNPSRLFLYYCERELENTINNDSGACLGDGCSALEQNGICDETMWEYDINQFTTKPISEAYLAAKNNTLLQFNRCENLEDILHSLASYKPVVMGISLYESFESAEVAKTGIVPMPLVTEQCLGGHAILACAYNIEKKVVTIRNSWSDKWGNKGYFDLPFDYFTTGLQEAVTLQIVK